jgi:hypothetical protein
MPKRKEKYETIITKDQEEITQNKTNLLGETRIRVTRTPKGRITKNTKGGKKKKTYGRNSLALFVVIMVIIITISSKFPTSNGLKTP